MKRMMTLFTFVMVAMVATTAMAGQGIVDHSIMGDAADSEPVCDYNPDGTPGACECDRDDKGCITDLILLCSWENSGELHVGPEKVACFLDHVIEGIDLTAEDPVPPTRRSDQLTVK